MKYRYLVLLFIPFLLHCPKHTSPGTKKKIEVYYLASVVDDLSRSEPLITGLFNRNGIKLGYLDNHNAGYSLFLSRLGLYDLLDSLPLDFLITDVPITQHRFLSISRSMGYGIMNYEGVRFGIVSQYAESLSIQDRVSISVIAERTDVMWVIDRQFLGQPAVKVDFMVRHRELQDTSLSKIKIQSDPAWTARTAAFARRLTDTLNANVGAGGQILSDYALDRLARQAGVTAVVYPATMFLASPARTDLRLRDLLASMDAAVRMKKGVFTRDSLVKFQADNHCLLWGRVDKTTTALVPDPDGIYVLDLLLR